MNDPLRIVIVDDEPLAISSLTQVLAQKTLVEVVGSFSHGDEAARGIPALKPDIVFLDIEMPGMNGLQVAEHIMNLENVAIVFVTAYSEHAIQAFKVHAVDYILKPYEDRQIFNALERFSRRQARVNPKLKELLSHLLSEQERQRFLSRILVKEGRRTRIVQVAEILWIEGARNYVALRTADKTYLYRHPLDQLATKLDPKNFVRIHRSKIINIQELALLDKPSKNQLEAITKDGVHHAVSERYRTDLERLLDS